MTVFMEKTANFGNFSTIRINSICQKFKAMSVNDCELNPKRIDIWQYPLHHLWDSAHDTLNLDEQERAARFHFARHRRRFIAAHAFLRIILSRYLKNKNPNLLEFNKNKYGKPELTQNEQNLQFNLTHSGEYALLAIGQEHPLGVDLEFFSAREYLDLAKYMFSAKELLAIKNVKLALQPITFFNIWAQKEAFIKACGMGLSYPTQEFTVPHLSSNNNIVVDNKHNQEWRITSFQPTITSCGAICNSEKVTEIRYLILEDGNALS